MTHDAMKTPVAAQSPTDTRGARPEPEHLPVEEGGGWDDET